MNASIPYLLLIGIVVSIQAAILKEKEGGSCQDCFQEESEPLCGDDEITYFNLCELNCTNLLNSTDVGILHEGLCIDSPEPDNLVSPVVHDPTSTIKNSVGRPIALPQKQQCNPFQDCSCNYDLLPVCGSDSITYPNECALNCAVHCNSKLVVKHEGLCDKRISLSKERKPN